MAKLVVATLVAAVVWFACQSLRLSTANTILRSKVTTENTRANKAEIELAAAQRRIIHDQMLSASACDLSGSQSPMNLARTSAPRWNRK